MLQHPAAVRAAFEEATDAFLQVVRAVPGELWDSPGALGEWTLRQLAGHTLRALTTIETYLAAEAGDRVIADAVEYYQVALADSAVHIAVAARGRRAGAQLSDPPGEAEAVAQRVLALVASTADDEPVNSSAGQMPFSEYLVTRTIELAVHTLDMQRAIGRLPVMGPVTSPVVLGTLTQLADPARLTLAITGRQPLPSDYNVLG